MKNCSDNILIGLSLIIICSGVYAQNKKLSKDNQYNNQTTNLMKTMMIIIL